MDSLADELSSLLENVAPKAFENLTAFSKVKICQKVQRC